MPPYVEVLRSRDAVVLRPRGPLVLGRGARSFGDLARRVIANGDVVILDLRHVTQMDAHGVGVLADLCAVARAAGRSLRVDGASARVTRLLRLTRLDSFLDCRCAPVPARAAAAANQVPSR